MFDGRKYYAKENTAARKEYQTSISRIKDLLENRVPSLSEPFRALMEHDGRFLLDLCAYENKIGIDYFLSRPIEELLAENNSFYRELEPAEYERSMANPAYAAAVFGPEYGPLMSFFHVGIRQHIRYAGRHEQFEMLESHRTWIELCEYLLAGKPECQVLSNIVTARQRKTRTEDHIRNLHIHFGPRYNLLDNAQDFPMDDPRVMFNFDSRVSSVEIDTFRFIRDLPEKDVDRIARCTARAYTRSFVVENKDRTGRTECAIGGSLGQERICRRLIERLREEGFPGSVKSFSSPPINRQYGFDHQFDFALYLTAELVEERVAAFRKAMDACEDIARKFSGNLFFESFGEPPFTPVMKKEKLVASDEQKKLIAELRRRQTDIQEQYLPSDRTSFTAVAFPSTEIGADFKEIFREMIKVNTLDPDEYTSVQQTIIDVLDTADTVRIKGAGDNATDMTVRLHPLANPEKETNFFNCGADVNIPAGEVFTSPQLAGTAGVLHFRQAHLDGRSFANLTLVFADGMITDYRCTNHPTPEENRRYIEQFILFPHKTLPLGEFAIGTNTRALAMSRRYNLLDRLPVLIIEKMGPHFAVGDTCYSHQEDHPIYNQSNGKEIVARDNEKSLLRRTDPENAYTFKHTDITLPFDEIAWITAVGPDGKETDIIRDGRFVLPGTESLNEPFDGLS